MLFFLFLSNFVKAQSINAFAVYNTKLAEDNFSFKASLYFDSNHSTYISKQNNNPVWKIKRESYEGSYLDIVSDEVYTDTVGHLVLKTVNTPILTVRDFCDKNEPFIYDDSVEIDWKIKSETKMIADLKCTRATASFRGRRYEAWFAPEIPVPYGPWKFNGLPGLIVKLKDKKEEVVIDLFSIDLSYPGKELIQIDDTAKNKISFRQFRDCLDREWERSDKEIKATFAQLQAEHPSLEIELEAPKKRIATELEFD